MNARTIKIAAVAVGLGVAAMALSTNIVSPAGATEPKVTMYKSPGCACCEGWKKHMEEASFEVKSIASDQVYRIKQEKGVPAGLESCHTAIVDSHVIEGHVPAEAVWRLLGEKDGPYGIAVPGMRSGSPGMGGLPELFRVISFEPMQDTGVYATYGGEPSVGH